MTTAQSQISSYTSLLWAGRYDAYGHLAAFGSDADKARERRTPISRMRLPLQPFGFASQQSMSHVLMPVPGLTLKFWAQCDLSPI
jgi:hypothetical protein